MIINETEPPFLCPKCGVPFDTKRGVRVHYGLMHKVVRKRAAWKGDQKRRLKKLETWRLHDLLEIINEEIKSRTKEAESLL